MAVTTRWFLLAACLLLQACATERRYFDGPQLPKESVGTLVGLERLVEHPRRTLLTRFDSVFDNGASRRVTLGPSWQPYRAAVRLLPGDYTVVAACMLHPTVSFPTARVRIEAGLTYELECDVHPQNPTSLVLKLRAVRTS